MHRSASRRCLSMRSTMPSREYDAHAAGGAHPRRCDRGRPDDRIMRAPAPIDRANYVLESTYGDRLHDVRDSEPLIGEAIRRITAQGGSVVIPSNRIST